MSRTTLFVIGAFAFVCFGCARAVREATVTTPPASVDLSGQEMSEVGDRVLAAALAGDLLAAGTFRQEYIGERQLELVYSESFVRGVEVSACRLRMDVERSSGTMAESSRNAPTNSWWIVDLASVDSDSIATLVMHGPMPGQRAPRTARESAPQHFVGLQAAPGPRGISGSVNNPRLTARVAFLHVRDEEAAIRSAVVLMELVTRCQEAGS